MSILGKQNARTWIGAAPVVGAAALLYFLTAARDIVVGDSPELITAAVTLGVPHPPGYPLFTMLGHLCSLGPVGPIPFRVNLFSVLCDALTVGIIYFTAYRLTRSRLAATVAAWILAVNAVFWTWSLAAEVFPLNNLLSALLILLLVRWYQVPERGGFLIAAFFVGGLALTNHQTIVLLVPACCFVLWQRRAGLWAQPKILAACLLAFVAGLLPYLYIPWASGRHPLYNWGNVASFPDFVAVITRKSYGSGQLVNTPEFRGGSPFARIIALGLSFGRLAGALTLLGAIHAFGRQRWYFWFVLSAFVCVGPFFVWIANLNLATAPSALFVLERFFLLSHVVLAPLLAFGVLMIAQFIARYAGALPVSPLRIVGATCLIATATNVVMNYRSTDQSHNSVARLFGEDLIGTVAPGSVFCISNDAVSFPLIYLQTVEGMGKDVTLIILPLLSEEWYARQLRERHRDLAIPFDCSDRTNSLKCLVDANKDRTIVIGGTIRNYLQSLGGGYWLYQHGLVMIVEPNSKHFTMEEMVADNEQLLRRYRFPAADSIKVGSFEDEILTLYAWPALRIGNDYELVGLKSEAQKWYERSLTIDPHLPQIREALSRVERQR